MDKSKMDNKCLKSGLIATLGVVALDQATKWLTLSHFTQSPDIIPVTSFFNLLLVWNKGVSFGMFNSGARDTVLILTIIPILITLALLVLLWQSTVKLHAFALGLIMGGALGNIIDRVRLGGVIDFLDFHIVNYHWPAFNIADSAITIGVVVLLIDSLWLKSETLIKD